MPSLEEVCTITAKGQTTVPKAIRQALGVGYGGRIAFRMEGNTVTLHALPEEDEADPALSPFLLLLESDLVDRPAEAIRPLTPALAAHLDAVASEVDPEAPINGEVTL
ncbi:type II toxin-antitoxin system PrlF family antitoxin [Roseomonas mucosa]|uniref:type II toxin-antitoxin system PrlF family antitoxin n=1 Tax=Roseomonas mucosa TaxID=207340 RepID=UPI001EF4E291|nr:type II toxin-antitoxin system PrlF family antitoxin [Roseomonas mucosa]MCG7357635.1 type II toxin-antitoxin system PrlF family antitoxin [Roseomonas mucosa]